MTKGQELVVVMVYSIFILYQLTLIIILLLSENHHPYKSDATSEVSRDEGYGSSTISKVAYADQLS